MADFKKDLLGFQDISFDTAGSGATFARETSTGGSQTLDKLNAAHIPLLLATRTLAMYNSGQLSANDVDTAITNICASLASVPTFSNKSVLDDIQSSGSGSIISTSERAKLNSITSIGSGAIITAQERAKLAGLTALTEDELEIISQVASLFPVGIIVAFPKNSEPTSFLECDGSALLRTTYSELFGVIGTDYGNNDSTDFLIPDLRGRFVRGWDHGAGNDPDAATRLNRGDGTSGDNVGTYQADEFESHSHNLQGGSETGNGDKIETSTGGSPDVSSDASGGNETRPKNVNLMYCIRYQAST